MIARNSGPVSAVDFAVAREGQLGSFLHGSPGMQDPASTVIESRMYVFPEPQNLVVFEQRFPSHIKTGALDNASDTDVPVCVLCCALISSAGCHCVPFNFDAGHRSQLPHLPLYDCVLSTLLVNRV